MNRVKSESIDPSKVQIMELDLSKPEECLKRVEDFCSKTNRVDIVINNAGLTMREEFINTDFKTCQYMINTNLISHIAITKAFLPLLKKQGGGQIVNMISVAGLIGTGFRTLYSAGKFGTSGFFKALRPEVQ